MITIREYARPATLEEAWQLNQKRPNRVLGGMLWLKMEKISVGTAIDLSALGLDTIEETDTEFAIGAMATLRSLETHAALNAATNGAMREAVRAKKQKIHEDGADRAAGQKLLEMAGANLTVTVPEAVRFTGFAGTERRD